MTQPTPAEMPHEKQQRMHDLLNRNSEGRISAAERSELEELVADAERFAVANAQKFADFSRHATPIPADAIPVTVWLKAQQTEP
jgi:hypothetical protein